MTGQAEDGEPAEAAALAGRLEQALDRIAAHAQGAKSDRSPAVVATRLDALITRLRGVLETDPAQE